MFPYDGVLKSISANNHYTRSEVNKLFYRQYVKETNIISSLSQDQIIAGCCENLQIGGHSSRTNIWTFRIW